MEISVGGAASTKTSYRVEGHDFEWGGSWAEVPKFAELTGTADFVSLTHVASFTVVSDVSRHIIEMKIF